MFRCSIPAITAILELVLFGKRRSLKIYLSLIPIIIGTMFVCLGDVHLFLFSNNRLITLPLVFSFFLRVVLRHLQKVLLQSAFSQAKTQSLLSSCLKSSLFVHSLTFRTPSSACLSSSSSFYSRNAVSSLNGYPLRLSAWFSCSFSTASLLSYWISQTSRQYELEVRWWWMWRVTWSRWWWWSYPPISSIRECGLSEYSAVLLLF